MNQYPDFRIQTFQLNHHCISHLQPSATPLDRICHVLPILRRLGAYGISNSAPGDQTTPPSLSSCLRVWGISHPAGIFLPIFNRMFASPLKILDFSCYCKTCHSLTGMFCSWQLDPMIFEYMEWSLLHVSMSAESGFYPKSVWGEVWVEMNSLNQLTGEWDPDVAQCRGGFPFSWLNMVRLEASI